MNTKRKVTDFFSCSKNYNLSPVEGEKGIRRICFGLIEELREKFEDIITDAGGQCSHGYCDNHANEKLNNISNEFI